MCIENKFTVEYAVAMNLFSQAKQCTLVSIKFTNFVMPCSTMLSLYNSNTAQCLLWVWYCLIGHGGLAIVWMVNLFHYTSCLVIVIPFLICLQSHVYAYAVAMNAFSPDKTMCFYIIISDENISQLKWFIIRKLSDRD